MPTPQFPGVPDYDKNKSVEYNLFQLYDAYIGVNRYLTYLLSALDTLNVSRLDAKVIIAGSITADKIGAGQVTADKIDVAELSAISANLGTIIAGSITSNTEINVGTDLRVGNNIYLGDQNSGESKSFQISNSSGSAARMNYLSGDIDWILDGNFNVNPSGSMNVTSMLRPNSIRCNNIATNDGRPYALEGLVGTKEYYVSLTPGGPNNHKITFENGILVSEG